MSIRKRTVEDLPEVSRLLEGVKLPSKGLERTAGWVIEASGCIVGHVAIEMTTDAAVLRSLVVAASQQGRGLGRELLDAAEAQAGQRPVVLKTDTIGAWVERRGYQRTTLDRIPASVLATTQFEGSLCSGYPVYLKPAGAVLDAASIKSAVRERYGAIVSTGASCCGPKSSGAQRGCGCGGVEEDPSLTIGYNPADLAAAPEGANLGLGCGNPVALASLRPGEVVLDLGSGAGFDAFLAAQRVGEKGRVIGVDMTPGMLAKARSLAAKHGYDNVEFRQGDIEELPVAEGSVDAIISNCVINLATDKGRVFREAFRVLRPGGRLMVSDLVLLKPLPVAMKCNLDAYAACLAGALLKDEYLAAIRAAGFEGAEVVGEAGYDFGDPSAAQVAVARSSDSSLTAQDLKAAAGSVVSVQISAFKPAKASCKGGATTFETNAQIATEALAAYIHHSEAGEGKVIHQPPMRDLAEQLEISGYIQNGGLTGEAFRNFLDRYLAATTLLRHPGYLAHQVAVTHPMGAVGSLIDGITNNPMAIYEMGPAPATIEFILINWMLEKVGWTPAPVPPTAASPTACGGGVLTHGGSLANLTALLAARGRIDPDAWTSGNRQDLVVLAPENCHYSISRAVGILGLGQQALKAAPTDPDGRLLSDRLPSALRDLRNAGSTVLAVVANACCTAVGLYDPLRETGQFCRENGLWLHVDGAHGASALLSEKLKHYLDGIEFADSLVWDAHKMLRTPGLCTAVLVRDHRDLDTAFQQDASYLFHDKEQPGFDFIHRTAECTKAGLGLKLFLVLAAEGEAALGRYVEEQTALARTAASWISEQADFEVAVVPESNIVCFRVHGADELQLELRRKLLQRGNYYVTAAEFRGRQWLRLAAMNPKTTLATIQGLIEEIRGHVSQGSTF